MATVQPSGADLPTVETFLRRILRSRLLDRAQLQEALRDVPKAQRDDAQALADHLVKKGKLSRFQASKILTGSGKGLVLDHYQVLAPIGRGGMSTVYLARDENSDRLVALKLLTPSRWRNQERLLARFQREMELSRRIIHPHLAWTYDSGFCTDIYYIAMEYIPGRNLSRIVKSDGPLSVPRAAHLMAEVAAGLHYAHTQGLIHRDLKPSNIMVTPHDHARVLDLGLALWQGEEEEEDVIGGQGYIVGTMDYIAPEQTADATNVDGRADIYSLGCTLYFAVSGRVPFPGGTSRDKIRRHRTELPTPLTELVPLIPPGFAQLIERMMAKEPTARPSTAALVEEYLRAWAIDEPELPMDAPEDSSYELSVAALQKAEPSAEYNLPNVSPPEDEQPEDGAQELLEHQSRRSLQTRMLILAVALVLCGAALLVGLVYLGMWLGQGR
jgi:serine/threonine protein kinase